MSYGVKNQENENLIKELKKNDRFFKNSINEAWVAFSVSDHIENCMVDSDKYQQRITKLYYNKHKRGIFPGALNLVINTLRSFAIIEGEKKELNLRIAEIDGKIYYDLTNDNYNIIEISKTGWKDIQSSEIFFKRYNHHKEQCNPLKGGTVKDLLKYLNNIGDTLLFVVYLVSCFIPNIQHPILILYGESGQGKSTISGIIKDIVDPSECSLLTITEKEDDFFINIDEHWLLAFDNISRISEKLSDNLCKVVTGIALSRRKLFKDKDTVIFRAKRCLVMNGIENAATKEDILNRALMFEVRRKIGHNVELYNELIAKFEKEKPYILGDIFNILVKAREIYPTLEFKKSYRMAEFAKWGFAIAEAIGGKGNVFLELYNKNIRMQDKEALDSNTLISSILVFMNELEEDYWEGRPSDLLPEIKRIAFEEGFYIYSHTMPKSAPELTKKLKSYVNILKRAGVEFIYRGHSNNGSKIMFRKL